MKATVSRWLALACCVFATASAAQDNVLRFLSNKEVVRMAQQKHSAGIKVSSSDYKGDLPMQKFRARSTVCPDGITQCPDTSTCCPLRNGQYGCCQGDNAVCCKDGVHCCPQGFKCDEQHGRCTSDTRGISFHWVDKKVSRAELVPHLGANKTCPDNKTQCQPNDTCCHARNNTFGCCPLSHAVCCSDGLHCCPAGTKCDVVHRHCYREEEDRQLPWVERRPKKPDPNPEVGEATSLEKISKKQAVTCKDGRMCPDGSTCCLLQNGSYGCCSFSDKKQTEKQLLQSVRSVVCPGGQFECPDNNTCCTLESGAWGCCPKPNAVCCSDRIHCCPNGYTCKADGCSKSSGQDSLLWSIKTPAMPREKVTTVKCLDGGYCSDGNTCCLLANGNYGCCPYPQAVCCSDKLHCCPHGFTCELALHSCKNSTSSIPWLEKKPAVFDVQSVICPDGKSQCPDGSTCCKTSRGSYGCCRYESAVCCSDGIHCCPHDTKCDLVHQTCNKSSSFIPWQEQMPALQRVQSVMCPDGKSECPDDNTCCQLSSGAYGCCPLPQAVCCSDHIHCCPQYTSCNNGTCHRGRNLIPWQEKMPALQRVQSVICPDGQSECPSGNTCCKLSSGGYGCCPLPHAVCCSDGVHCCPSGYDCDPSAGTCSKDNYSVPWQKKQPALHRVQSVICPDGTTTCPNDHTCCRLSSGAYGCCPLPNAVCCSDFVHCCPSGYVCNPSNNTCDQGSYSVPWQKKQPALHREQSVVCPDDKSQCPDGNTCCKQSSGDYGCCPLPDAVCCSDGEHCCPKSYTCDLAHKACKKGSYSLPWQKKQPALRSLP